MNSAGYIWALVAALSVLLVTASIVIYSQWQSAKFRKENNIKSRHAIRVAKRRRRRDH